MPNFDKVKSVEQKEIGKARSRRQSLPSLEEHRLPDPEKEDEAVGLAFSGGGIRSATFNLGVLQGLARYNLLPRFDYLSTVSGGGYIGSWLISWIRRRGLEDAIEGLASSPPEPPVNPGPPPELMKPCEPPAVNQPYQEAQPINFLRDYSNYLTPRVGIFGADTWAAISTYIRNLLLNLAILVAFLSSILLLPRVWEALFLTIAAAGPHPPVFVRPLLWWSGALVLAAVGFASWHISSHVFASLLENRHTGQNWVLSFVVAPLFLAAALASVAIWLGEDHLHAVSWGYWACWGAIGYLALRAVGLILAWLFLLLAKAGTRTEWRQELIDGFWVVLWAPLAGAMGGVLTGFIAKTFYDWSPLAGNLKAPPASGIAKLACWGTPLLVAALLLTGVLHIGLLSLNFSNQKREWWARMTGWLLICCLSAAALFGLGIYAPLSVSLLSGYAKTKSALIGGWILTTLGGLLAGKSGSTSGTSGGNAKLEIAARIAPYVFVVGLLVALSFGIHRIASSGKQSDSVTTQSAKVSGDLQLVTRDTAGEFSATLTDLKLTYSARPGYDAQKIKDKFWAEVEHSSENRHLCWHWNLPGWAQFLCAALVLGVFALALSMRVDINEFSMHLLYRNRLVRCYLGASNEDRKPQLFSGFDPRDDQFLSEFCADAPAYKGKRKYEGPYPILNCTLNITHGERLAWQERKGESFVFTPRFCGYQFQEQHPIDRTAVLAGLGWLPRVGEKKQIPDDEEEGPFKCTKHYAYPDGGVYLGTAMATSGAAVSPNMGFHTSPPLAFLMTVFNVRLGWWLGNPRRPETWRRATPLPGLFYLLTELFALTDDRSRYVYLSDGAHFENLALYELVRRRCRYIVVCDAGADPRHSFEDLGNAIRKCRTDFGIDIEMDLSPLQLRRGKKYSQAHGVVGTIHYEQINPELQPGKLVYLKASLTENDPVDVQTYKRFHPAFPHQSTADQWFDESQFESYRQLGRFSMESALAKVGTPDMLAAMSTADIFNGLPRRL